MQSRQRSASSRCALAEPLVELHERFTNVHRGFRKLLGEYRRDKRTVAAFTTEVVNLDDAVKDLGLAVSWARARSDYDAAEQGMAASLGRYWTGRSTDFEALDEALANATQLVQQVPEFLLPQVATSAGGPPDPAVKLIVEQTRADMARLRALISDSRSDAARPELLLGTVAGASEGFDPTSNRSLGRPQLPPLWVG